MKETFLYALRAILPILMTIAAGYVARRIGPWDQKFYKSLNKLSFHLFLPLNLFCNIYGIEDLSQTNWGLAGFLFAGIFASMFLGIILTRFLIREQAQKGPMVQASFRSNQAVLGLPLANALGGQAAMGFASIASAICVPMFNVLAVIVLTVYGGDTKTIHPRKLAGKILKNPLIMASVIAMLIVGLRQVGAVPAYFLRDSLPSVYKVLSDFGKVASPLMLFVLGAGLDFKATGHLLPQISLGVLTRLVLSPALILGTALLFREPLGLTTLEMPTLVAMAASPVAVSSSVMVQEIGGDDQFAGQLVVWSSVLSMVSIFIITFILRTLGAL